MAISKDLKRLEHSAVSLTLTVSADEVRTQYDELIVNYSKNIQIPGFRKGKVPKNVLESKFGESLKAEASGRIMEKAVHEVFEAEDIPLEERPLPYSTPEVQEEPELDLEKDLQFTIKYDVFPSIKIPEWKGIDVEVPVTEVSADDIKRELEQIRERNAIVMDKDDSKAAAKDDVLTVNYCELDEKGTVIQGTEREDFVFTAGSGSNIFKFDDEVIGMKKNESKDFDKKYPADFEDTELAGKEKKLRVTLTAIKEKKLPDLDDDLAQDVNEKFKTMEDLKADIKSGLEKNLENKIRELKVNAILEKILEKTDIDLPESMIRIEQESRWRNLARRFNADSDQLMKILASSGKSYEDLMNDWRPEIEKSLKSRLVVEEIIKELKIEASDEDIEKEIETMAAGMNMDVAEVKKHYEQENMKEYLREDIKERKVFDNIIAEAKIKKGKKQKYLDLMDNNR